MKDLAFELSVPADPAFRSIAAEAAGMYGESLGLPAPEAGALTASAQEAVDAAAASGGTISVGVTRAGDSLELTVTGDGGSATLSRSLAGAKS